MTRDYAVIHALPTPVVVVSSGGRIAALNAAAEALIGTACTGWNHVTALRQPAILAAIETCRTEGQTQQALYLKKDGARDRQWTVTVAASGDTIVLSFEDRSALTEAGEMRRDFVANVSHELRTPLTSLLGFIETLRGPAKDDPKAQARFLEIMEREAGRMHQLVEDLLSLSHVEALERQRPSGRVALGQLMGGVAETLAPMAAASNVELIIKTPETDGVIPGDDEQLGQVLRNLVENAIKYGGPNAQVTLTLEGPEHWPELGGPGLCLSVADEGPGIPAHQIPRLTERFYRIDSHRNRDVGGTGLGLAIVKRIVQRHRGQLRIGPNGTQGSVFKVFLPISGQ